MKRYLKLTSLFARYSLMQNMIYYQDFLIWALVSAGWTIFTILFYQILFQNVDSIAGWTQSEMLLLQGFFFIFEGFLWGLFWSNFREIPIKINKGTLDFDLIKPINTQFLLSFRTFSLDNLTNIVLGLFLVNYSIRAGNIQISIIQILSVVFVILVALVFIYSTYFISMCLAFWFDRFDNLHFLYPSLNELWHYPQDFYQGILRYIFVILTPLGIITSLPAEILISHISIPDILRLIFFAIFSLYISRIFFNHAIRQYSSASS